LWVSATIDKTLFYEAQLSVFIQILQIRSGYMDHIVMGNPVSNRNLKNEILKIEKGQIQAAGFSFPGWDIL